MNLVVSMAIGDKSRRYSEVTFPLIQKYAQKCNADFLALYTENKAYDQLGYQKWDYLGLLDRYERILHIDADMVVRSTTPSIFDLVMPGYFAGVNEWPYQNLAQEYLPIDRYQDMLKIGPVDPSFYINVGLYLFDASHKNIFSPPIKNNPCYFKEQAQINYNLQGKRVTLLSPNFNYMSLMEKAGLKKDDAHIIHYAGGWAGQSEEEVIELMKRDIR